MYRFSIKSALPRLDRFAKKVNLPRRLLLFWLVAFSTQINAQNLDTCFSILVDHDNYWDAYRILIQKNDSVFYNIGGWVNLNGTDSTRFNTLRITEVNIHNMGLVHHDFHYPGASWYAALDRRAIVPDQNGNVYLTGGIQYPNYNGPGYIMKIGPDGDSVYMKTWGNVNKQVMPNSMLRLDDGRMLVCGITNDTPTGGYYSFLAFFDSSGNYLNQKLYGQPGEADFAANFMKTPDGGYLLVGSTTIQDSVFIHYQNGVLIRTDSLGNLIWRKKIGGHFPFSCAFGGAIPTRDGNLVAYGYMLDSTMGGNQMGFKVKHALLKMNWNGDRIWRRFIGNEHPGGVATAMELDNGSIVCTSVWEDTISYHPYYIAKFTADGDSIWLQKHRIGPLGHSVYLWGLVTVPEDKGFMLCGLGDRDSNSPQDAWILRVDSLGLMEDCGPVNVTPPVVFNVSIYPNPASDYFYLDIAGADSGESFSFQIWDITGRNIYFQDGIRNGKWKMELYSFSTGLYLYHVISNQGQKLTGKIIFY